MLGLDNEPFSTSPDPKFFYESKEHKSALYRLRVAIELRRGLSIVLGEVGTGKTTLSRRLSQLLIADPALFMVMILNPVYESELQFLSDLANRLHVKSDIGPGEEPKVLDYLKAIEKFLFDKGVEQGKTIVILIDEAQKLNEPCLEVLRSLLNYETNEYKILQVVLMGQMELLPRITKIKNFWDRIALKYVINPLEESEASEMIDFRLKEAGYVSRYPLFNYDSIRAIYTHTQGYPRKISLMCHDALEYLVMHKKEMVDKDIIDNLARHNVKMSLEVAASGGQGPENG